MGWRRMCALDEAPAEDAVIEMTVDGQELCVARVGGVLHVLANLCPHRQGPLGQGWIEGNTVVCPWHSWVFDVQSGNCEYPGGEGVAVIPVKTNGDTVYVDIASAVTQPR